MSEPTQAPEQGRSRAAWIGTVAAVFLGGVLLVATWAKVIDPAAFIELVELEGLDFLLPSWVVAAAAVGIEAGLGLALVLNMRRLWILLPTAGLCLFFLYLTGRAYLAFLNGEADPANSCGCFGNLVERTPTEAFWSDLLLLLPPLVLAFLGRPRGNPVPRLRLELVIATVLVVLGFGWKATDLPLDNLATRMRPGVQVTGLCAGQGPNKTCLDHLAPELEEGRFLVLIADLDQRDFRYAVPRLNSLAASDASIGLIVFTAAEADEIKRFQWELGPTFDIRHAPASLLRPLYRRTPRTALLENGRVIRTYDGLPPSEDFTPPAAAKPKQD